MLAHDNLIDRIYVCMALSKIAVCFVTANGRGIDVAKRLLEFCTSLRLLCWAHVLRNVAIIALSGELFRQRLLSLVETTKHLGH